jgi:glutamine amidotransferase
MIVIINSGLGNIASVLNMVRKVGGDAIVSNQKQDILQASKLILPGVGAFDHGINQLKILDLFGLIQVKALSGTPLLGICLGMQILSKGSEEGDLSGLNLIDAEFKRFTFGDNILLRVPHVGWNLVNINKPNPIIIDNKDEQRFYFTHSYHANCTHQSDVLATTEYGYVFVSAYSRENIYGVQFHPEKSHRFGMKLINNFLKI